jgi:uncharacterized protein with FMN-binding domain/DMSO/TMAO reductase YedYZ heme-binding membrane subunit
MECIMYTLIALLIAVSFTIVCRNALKRNPAPFYTAFAVIAAFCAILKLAGGSVPAFVTAGLLPMITGGYLAAALFLIVMITGVFANGSTPKRFLAPIRGPLSILACILTFSHAAADLPSMLSGRTGVTAVSVCSIALMAVMIPLFITSIPSVRSGMSYFSWKRIQRLAYVFYALLFLHVMILAVPGVIDGDVNDTVTVIAWFLIFASWLACRTVRALLGDRPETPLWQTQLPVLLGTFMLVAIVFAFTSARLASADMTGGGTAVSGPAAESGAAANGSDSSENPDESSSRQESAASGDENDSGSSGSASSSGTYQDGTYEGSGTGRNGTIDVTVTVSGGKITAIEIGDNREDEKWLARAESVIDEIIAANGTDVDTVSGATFSSSGIIEAVRDALKNA